MLACWLARQRILRLLDDAETAALVKGLLKTDGGIARLENEAWLAVSAPQRLAAAEAPLACLACPAGRDQAAR